MKTFFRIAISFSVILAVMTGCEENLEFSRKVTFSAAGGYQNGPKTKTAYTATNYPESGKSYERIDWVVNDLFRVASDVARTESGDASSDYKVTHVSGNTSRISNADVAEAGTESLSWGSGTNTFYALYPSPATTGAQAGVDISATTTGATFTGVIPRNQTVTLQDGTGIYQPDMCCAYMWAATSASATSSDVNLAFQPAMTALEFTIGNPESGTTLVITHLRIRALNNGTALSGSFTGTIDKSSLACTYECTAGTDNARYIDIDFSPALSIPYGDAKKVTALALPQDLTGLTVILTLGNGETRTLELKNDTGSWYTFDATKKYHIVLGVPTSYVYTFEVTKNMSDPDYNGYIGSNADYTVISNKSFSGSNYKTGVAWTAEFSTDGGATWSSDKPVWLTEFTSAQTGTQAGSSSKSYRAQVRAITGHNLHSDELKSRDPRARGSETAPWDLSTHTISGASSSKNTANCYVVDRPGWYMLPLVYGNAIKDGSDNKQSYNPTGLTGDANNHHALKPFRNHNNANITGPNITTTITRAGLVWQDAEDLVTSVSLQGSGYIKFYVSPETICQGNAVIAAFYGNGSTNIAWSWHIWVTDQDLTAQSVTWAGTGITQSFMPYDLGWCEGGSVTWTPRSVQIRFTQEESNETRTFTINQSGHTQTLLGNAPYYQWGRKDPMIPAKGDAANTGDNKTWYDGSGATYVSGRNIIVDNSTKDLGWAIRRPNTIILNPDNSNYNWCSTNWFNLWNSAVKHNQINTRVVATGKTVYDPCPPGYVVPSPGMFPSTPAEQGTLPGIGTYDATYNWFTYGNMNWPVLGNRLRLYGNAPSYNDGGQTVTGYGNYSGGYGKLMTSITDETNTHSDENTYCVVFGSPLMTEIGGYYANRIGLIDGMGKASAGNVRCVPE